MNWRLVSYVLGSLCFVIGMAMLPSIAFALFQDDTWTGPHWCRPIVAFTISIIICLMSGFLLRGLGSKNRQDRVNASEGFGVAAFGWILMAFLGALPYYFLRSGVGHLGFIECYFESMSGFTTTGSSIFGTALNSDVHGAYGAIESLPVSLLFWRSLTHWIGGMGIVVLVLAVLPALRAGGYPLFAAEVPGPTADRLLPRIRQTAAVLWGVYLLLTIVETGLLWMGGMSLFESTCHAFATMATGGFSTRDASVGAYAGASNGLYIEMVINLFMFLAGCNFLLHYTALRGTLRGYWSNAEFKFYCLVLGVGTLSLALLCWAGNLYPSIWSSLRYSLFQTLSITTTTGFATTNTNLWPDAARLILILLMFFGGCAGSTGGGIKQVRVLVVLRYILREWKRLLLPRFVNPVRIGDTTMEERLVSNIVGLALLWFFIFAGGSLLIMLILGGWHSPSDGMFITGVSAVAACLNNIGPGLDQVGSTANFSWMPGSAKLLLSFLMLLGRLEIYSVLVLILPLAWRR